MALIVEDGSIVANANSYVDETAIVAFALDRGVTITTPDATKFGILAMDYLSLFDDEWKGEQVDAATQTLAWPREDVFINCVELPSDTIPAKLKTAQLQLTLYASQGIILVPTGNTSGGVIIREKIGPIETQYSEKIAYNAGTLPDLPAVSSLLGAFLEGNGAMIRTVRV
jgi:hypothetical protein